MVGFLTATVAVLVAGGIVFAVWFTGGMLGQRCAHAYPDDGLAQERCIFNLKHNRAP